MRTNLEARVHFTREAEIVHRLAPAKLVSLWQLRELARETMEPSKCHVVYISIPLCLAWKGDYR